MPCEALTLLGFFDGPSGVHFLHKYWVDAPKVLEDLVRTWVVAQSQRGERIAMAGNPEITEIPDELADHIDALKDSINSKGLDFTRHQLKWVEVAPLLAYQFHVDEAAVDNCATGVRRGRERAALEMCLPLRPAEIPTTRGFGSRDTCHQAVLISPNLNMRIKQDLWLEAGENYAMSKDGSGCELTFVIGESSPLVRVSRYGGRCYLKNGYHRACGIMAAGLRFMPCVLEDVAEFKNTGAEGNGFTFSQELLETDDPPTVAHFSPDRAVRLRLHSLRRVIKITWESALELERDADAIARGERPMPAEDRFLEAALAERIARQSALEQK
jgi:hypothetical protein